MHFCSHVSDKTVWRISLVGQICPYLSKILKIDACMPLNLFVSKKAFAGREFVLLWWFMLFRKMAFSLICVKLFFLALLYSLFYLAMRIQFVCYQKKKKKTFAALYKLSNNSCLQMPSTLFHSLADGFLSQSFFSLNSSLASLSKSHLY